MRQFIASEIRSVIGGDVVVLCKGLSGRDARLLGLNHNEDVFLGGDVEEIASAVKQLDCEILFI